MLHLYDHNAAAAAMSRPGAGPAPQELASVANDPAAHGWGAWAGWTLAAVGGAADAAAPPTLPPGALPDPRREDFEPYLRAAGAALEAFQRDRAAAEAAAARAAAAAGDAAAAPTSAAPSPEEAAVPPLFARDDFSLDLPELWAELGDARDDDAREAAAERLGRHLDAVEGALVREIGARHEGFFAAARHVQDAAGAAERLHARAAAIRSRVAGAARDAAAAVAESAALRRRRAAAAGALELARAAEGAGAARAALRDVLDGAAAGGVDYAAALDVADALRGALARRELLALRAFASLPAQFADALRALEALATAELLDRARFVGAGACADAAAGRARAQAAASTSAAGAAARGAGAPGGAAAAAATVPLRDAAGLARAAALLRPAWAAEMPLDVDALRPLAAGLSRLGRLGDAARALRADAVAQAAALVDDAVRGALRALGAAAPEAPPDGHLLPSAAPGAGSAAAAAAAKLPSEQFVWVLEAALLAAQAAMEHFGAVGTAVAAAAAAVEAPAAGEEAAAGNGDGGAAGDGGDLSAAVAEAAAARWAKLLAARARRAADGGRLAELADALALADLLAAAAERAGARSEAPLRAALQALCRAELDGLHRLNAAKLAALLEQEAWAPLEVAPRVQRAADALLGEAGSPAAGAGAAPAATLRVGAARFHAVQAAQSALCMLGDYVALADLVPALRADAAARVLELLKTFNARACQLVLGAGAMHTAGLRSITARHLAASSQAVAALEALHPALEAALVEGLPPARAAAARAGYARSREDCLLHCAEIRGKLVGMMGERLGAAAAQLPTLAAAWPGGAAAPGAPPPPPSAFAATAARQLEVLAGALAPLLPEEEVGDVLGRVGRAAASELAAAYAGLQLRGAAGRAQALADLDFLLAALAALPGEPAERAASVVRLRAARDAVAEAGLPPAQAAPEQALPEPEALAQAPEQAVNAAEKIPAVADDDVPEALVDELAAAAEDAPEAAPEAALAAAPEAARMDHPLQPEAAAAAIDDDDALSDVDLLDSPPPAPKLPAP
jgi:vacuolar protein sorting-associated protein 54